MVRTTDYELWTTEIGLHTVTQVNTEVKKRRVPQYELRTRDYKLRAMEIGLQTMDYRQWKMDYGLSPRGIWNLTKGDTHSMSYGLPKLD